LTVEQGEAAIRPSDQRWRSTAHDLHIIPQEHFTMAEFLLRSWGTKKMTSDSGLVLGAGLGLVIGAFFGAPGIGLIFGAGVGLTLGAGEGSGVGPRDAPNNGADAKPSGDEKAR
jgi:hypothetical protein